jgi:hypothetical protein
MKRCTTSKCSTCSRASRASAASLSCAQARAIYVQSTSVRHQRGGTHPLGSRSVPTAGRLARPWQQRRRLFLSPAASIAVRRKARRGVSDCSSALVDATTRTAKPDWLRWLYAATGSLSQLTGTHRRCQLRDTAPRVRQVGTSRADLGCEPRQLRLPGSGQLSSRQQRGARLRARFVR